MQLLRGGGFRSVLAVVLGVWACGDGEKRCARWAATMVEFEGRGVGAEAGAGRPCGDVEKRRVAVVVLSEAGLSGC